MKTTKSPEDTEVTPSKKKLKQARLPFKIISDVSPSPATPSSRKRKLSATDADSITKAVKICKENDVCDDPVVISDDDSKDGKTPDKDEKPPNPYVKLVDAVLKKKIQKSKGKKKRSRKSSKNVKENGSVETSDTGNTADERELNDCELMEVDELDPEVDTAKEDSEQKSVITKETETTNVNKSIIDTQEILEIDDSNNSCDVQMSKEDEAKNCENPVKEITTNESVKPEDVAESSSSSKEQECELSSDKESQDNDNKNEIEKSESIAVKESNEEKQTFFSPKRSARNKKKEEENNNKDSPSNKLNDSVVSNPSTPRQSRSSSVTKLDESLNESLTSTGANLTPKQLQKKLESAKKREEREKEKIEREKKKQQEKEERAKQKQEKEDQKKREREEKEEAKRKEKEEKEEQRRKEKEEKEKQKELEKKVKEEKEEQKKKDKEAKEEEKRKKQEALEQEKQEQELKKKKASEAFVNFFVPKQKTEKDQATVGIVDNGMLSSFTIKADMRLAPTTRVNLTTEKAQNLEKLIKEQNVEQDALYLKSLKCGVCKPQTNGKTWPLSDKDDDDDVILVEDELPPLDGAGESVTCDAAVRENLRPKLFSFHENRRPPYWGTWRKKSSFIKPRKPFGQDEKQLDYEVDSDDDWEEEQEGESIDGSAAGSDDEQGPDEYEVDNEVFVPHGYLSDEEATMDEDDMLSLSPETQKARLKHLEDEFETEMKKPTEKLKPRLYGIFWENADGSKPENCADSIWKYFGKLAMIMDDPTPFLQPPKEIEEPEKKKVKKKKVTTEGEQNNSKPEKKKKTKTEEIKKEGKSKQEIKKPAPDLKKSQPGINMFLTKLKPS